MIKAIEDWAAFTFGQCNLGDKRRTQRLVRTAANMAKNIGQSVVKSSPTSADSEGTYRLIRNQHISANEIAEGGFLATAELAKDHDILLALEDITSLTYRHSVGKQLGYTGNAKNGKTKGMHAHSVMLYDPSSEHILGLIEQRRWVRDEEKFGNRRHNQKRAYETKESYKWEQASQAVAERLGETINQCISVCDREADVVEYLAYKQAEKQRFVVRAKSNRPLAGGERLYDYAEQLEVAGGYVLNIPQRGGRKARKARMTISYAPVSVLAPERKQETYSPIDAYVVICQEHDAGEESLTWVLLTSEPVKTLQDALTIVSYYEKRWKIEDFHKVWKSEGTGVEALRMQYADNLERMSVIMAFIAIRLMQLKGQGDKKDASITPCTHCLSPLQWKVLWKKQHKGKPLPKTIPDMKWAYQALGKLAGWNDSKRTGRVGWNTLWEGWNKLELLVEAYYLFQVEEM